MIDDFLPDKVAEEVTEELGAIIVALETELVDKLAGEKAKKLECNLSEQSPRNLTILPLTSSQR